MARKTSEEIGSSSNAIQADQAPTLQPREQAQEQPKIQAAQLNANANNANPAASFELTDEMVKKYETYFTNTDTQKKGFISGQEAKIIFSRSNLQQKILGHIWALADKNSKGHLTKGEFIVALFLIARARQGVEIPPQLPLNLENLISTFNLQQAQSIISQPGPQLQQAVQPTLSQNAFQQEPARSK